MTAGHKIASTAVANFLTSLTGGIILARGLSLVEKMNYIRFDSILAYLLGSFVAFFLILIARRRGYSWLPGFSLFLLVPLILLWFLWDEKTLASLSNEIIFAASLTLYFAVAACIRSLRSDMASGLHPYGVNCSEWFYSAGYLAGLGLQSLAPFEKHQRVLELGAALLPLCLIFDILSIRGTTRSVTEEKTINEQKQLQPIFFPIVGLLFCLTALIQVGTSRLASILDSALPLTSFEIGVTVAPILAAASKTRLFFRPGGKSLVEVWGKIFSFPSALTSILGMGALALLSSYFSGDASHLNFALIFFSSIGFEWVFITLLGELGKQPGQVMLAFGINGFLVSFLYWALLRVDQSNSFLFASYVGLCVLVSPVLLHFFVGEKSSLPRAEHSPSR